MLWGFTQRTAFFLFLYTVNLWTLAEAELKGWTDEGTIGGSGVGEKWRKEYGSYLNAFAIKLKEGQGREVVQEIAAEHGFRLKAELPHSRIFVLDHPTVGRRSKRSSTGHLDALQNDPRISHAQQEVLLQRTKRRVLHDKQLELPIRTIADNSLYNRYQPALALTQRDTLEGGGGAPSYRDPLFKDMWYLDNQGQSGGENGLDLNVGVVWENGITGKGVVVCILDDGIDHTHPDLKDNYDPDASTDLNDKYDFTDDPMPDMSDTDNSHGTRCAGEIAAAANNNVCGVGVAYNAKIGGVRVLDGPVSDSLEAEAISFNRDYIDVYSASWGPNDDGSTMEGPRQMALDALMDGVKKGRNGLGSIYVWATGNGGTYGDDCSADSYVSRPETLSVGSVNDWGRSPYFMENCSSTLAVVPSGGEDYRGQEEDNGEVKLKVITTDVSGGCIENFQGTSSAAPLAAGCVANVLQANPFLSWRDVQHIVVQGTRVPSVDASWTINGAGRHVSHRFGFGLMDCGRMVGLAQDWEPVSEQRSCNTTRKSYRPLKSGGRVTDTIMSDGCQDEDQGSRPIDRLEHVQVYIKMTSTLRGDTAIYLVSPAGTRSVLLSPRPMDKHKGDWEFMFMTVHSWDESPQGKWTLEVHHRPQNRGSLSNNAKLKVHEAKLLIQKLNEKTENTEEDRESTVGYLKEWSLTLFGTDGSRHQRAGLSRDRKQTAYKPTTADVAQIKKREVQLSRQVKVKRTEPTDDREVDNTVKDQGSTGVDGKTERIMERLWTLLHAHGARDVRKRVLQNQPAFTRRQDFALQTASKRGGLMSRKSSRRQEMASPRTNLRELLDLTEDLIEQLKARKAGG